MSIFKFLLKKENYIPKIIKLNNTKRKNTTLLTKIFKKELDVLIINNAISDKEIALILNKLKELPENLVFPTPFGTIYGKTLIGSETKMKQYSNIGKELNDFFIENSQIDINSLIKESISNVTKNKNIECANICNIQYTGYTVKRLEPQKGGLHVHIGSEFLKLLPECNQLVKEIKNADQISFFYILQTPEKGGELVLFDLDWDSSPPELIDDKSFYSHEEREAFFAKRKEHVIKPKKGDLIIFNGGNVWHKINDIEGQNDRITFGGFLGQSLNDKKVLFWN